MADAIAIGPKLASKSRGVRVKMRTLQVPNPATYIWFPTHTMYSATYVFIHAVLSGWMSSGKLLIFAKVSI